MPEFILGARGHDFGRHDPETLFSSIGQAGFACTQLAFPKAVEGVKSYDDVTPALVERARAAAAASGIYSLFFSHSARSNRSGATSTGPIAFVYAFTRMFKDSSSFAAIAPAATRPIVSRPEERPPPR